MNFFFLKKTYFNFSVCIRAAMCVGGSLPLPPSHPCTPCAHHCCSEEACSSRCPAGVVGPCLGSFPSQRATTTIWAHFRSLEMNFLPESGSEHRLCTSATSLLLPLSSWGSRGQKGASTAGELQPGASTAGEPRLGASSTGEPQLGALHFLQGQIWLLLMV